MISPENMTDPDYADDLALLSNIPAEVESHLQHLKQAVRGIDLYMNANKIIHAL